MVQLFFFRITTPLILFNSRPYAVGRGGVCGEWADQGPDAEGAGCGRGRRQFSGTEGTEEWPIRKVKNFIIQKFPGPDSCGQKIFWAGSSLLRRD